MDKVAGSASGANFEGVMKVEEEKIRSPRRRWPSGFFVLDETDDLFVGRESVLIVLREDQLTVDGHVEHAAAAPNELGFDTKAGF